MNELNETEAIKLDGTILDKSDIVEKNKDKPK